MLKQKECCQCGGLDEQDACYHCYTQGICYCIPVKCESCQDTGVFMKAHPVEEIDFEGQDPYWYEKIDCPECTCPKVNHSKLSSRSKDHDSWLIVCSCGRQFTAWRWLAEERFNEHID